MRPNSPIPTPSLGRTLAFALMFLGCVAVFQLGAVTVAFFKSVGVPADGNPGDGSRSAPLKIDVRKLVAEVPPPDDPGDLGSDPLAVGGGDERFQGPRPIPTDRDPVEPPATGAAEPKGSIPEKLAAVVAGAPPRPTPVPLSVFTIKPDPRFSELVEQGKLLRNSGDTAGALVKFRAAGTLEPANALPIAEQAYTYEKMSLPDKAAEQWRRILAMGERAGVYFSAAKSKLDSAMQTTIRETSSTAAVLPAGKVLGLGKPTIVDDASYAGGKKFAMNVPIHARINEPVSVREMKVFVLFYDRLNGKEITRTNANVSNRWGAPPADWRDGDTETLEVTYESSDQSSRGERREYHGYIVRLYYRGELQDTQAEPAGLNQKFPAPFTLSE